MGEITLKHVKRTLFILCFLPWIWTFYLAVSGGLGAEPIKGLLHELGQWTLRFLLLTLSITPVRRLTGVAALIRLRRLFGLYTFFYALTHFSVYLLLDLGLDWATLGEDIIKRPYITVGFSAWMLMAMLAATSTNNMMRRMGRRWKSLHRSIYTIALLGIVHYYWSVKADVREPLIYAGVFVLLMVLRLRQQPRSGAQTSRISPHALPVRGLGRRLGNAE